MPVMIWFEKDDGVLVALRLLVVATDVHYPTDITLLLRHAQGRRAEHAPERRSRVQRLAAACLQRPAPQRHLRAARARARTVRDEARKEKRRAPRRGARGYLGVARGFLDKARETLARASSVRRRASGGQDRDRDVHRTWPDADRADATAGHLGEVIPHAEKVFSVFETHTESISKGQAGVPVGLGLRVCHGRPASLRVSSSVMNSDRRPSGSRHGQGNQATLCRSGSLQL